MMRITVVTGPFLPLPPAPAGAVERIWHDLGREFARRGHQVTFVSRAWPGENQDESVDGVRYLRRMTPRRTGRIGLDLAKDLHYSMRIAGLLPPADILVTNVFCLPIFAPLRRKTGRLVINVQRYPKHQLRLYPGAARFAVVSAAVRDAIAEQIPSALPITRVIPNPIDLSAFTPPLVARSHQGEQTILYTGRVHPEKGLHVLIEAFALLATDFPLLRLRIVGPTRIDQGGGGPAYVRQLRSRAGEMPVRLDEPIYERKRLAEALRAAHFYCYPSLAERGETFGVAPLEAMATGLAPVVSDLACFRDFLEPDRNGYVFDHRTASPATSLAATLRKLLSDPLRAAAAGQQAAARALDFSCAAVAAQYLDDFESLMAATDGRSNSGETRFHHPART